MEQKDSSGIDSVNTRLESSRLGRSEDRRQCVVSDSEIPPGSFAAHTLVVLTIKVNVLDVPKLCKDAVSYVLCYTTQAH